VIQKKPKFEDKHAYDYGHDAVNFDVMSTILTAAHVAHYTRTQQRDGLTNPKLKPFGHHSTSVLEGPLHRVRARLIIVGTSAAAASSQCIVHTEDSSRSRTEPWWVV